MFGTLGGPELFLILVVALIVFGPRKLPEIGKSVGKMMAEFRKASNDFKRTIEDEVEAEKLREATRIEAPAWSTAEPPLAALPPARSEPADAGAPSSPDPDEAESRTEVGPGETSFAPADGVEATGDAGPLEGGPPAETVGRGTLPGETK